VIVTVNSFKMMLDLKNDTGISRDLFLFRKREHLSTDYVLENHIFKRGTEIIDLGANIGYYALLESAGVGDNGKVYAIEPVSRNFNNLEKNIILNNVNNIRTFKLAIGDKNCVTEINVGEKGNFSSFLRNSAAVYTGTEEVQMFTLDEFVKRESIKPSLIRMDVEGYETKIIEGMRETLLGRPALLIEIHPHLVASDELAEMMTTLINSGYTRSVVIKERKDVWMKKNGEIKPILKFISSYIEGNRYVMGTGSVEEIDINELKIRLRSQYTAFHALLT
jgi:FkbM family methyltransferase